jgi:acyl-CoA thioester hydrolase
MFKAVIDVYYEDTDCGGVVYYANYLKYFERARTQMLIHHGVNPAEWMKKGVVFTVARAEVDYKLPAVYGDRLSVETKITILKGARISFSYSVMRDTDSDLLATGVTDMACVNEKMRPIQIPEQVMGRLSNIVEA